MIMPSIKAHSEVGSQVADKTGANRCGHYSIKIFSVDLNFG